MTQKLLTEGGAAGHLMHLYDNPELTFRKIKRILAAASLGKIVATEKTDGANIFLSWRDGHGTAARNKKHLISGGMTVQDLAKREFAGGERVRKAYVSAFTAYEKAIKSLDDATREQIFGPDGTIWYNAEIQGPAFTNVINYDRNVITIHHTGHKQVEPETGQIVPFEDPNAAKVLDQVIDQIEQKQSNTNFKLARTAVVKLKGLANNQDLQIAKLKIDKVIRAAGLSDANTIEDYLKAKLMPYIEQALPEVSEDIKELVYENIMGRRKLTGSNGLPKGTPRELRQRISAIRKQSKDILSRAIFPIEDAIHDFSVELLRGLESAYILDNTKEVKRLRKELAHAIRIIQNSGNEEALSILAKQLTKIKHHDNISTAVEGVVFQHDGNTYKFTGNFAPINQILGLFRYGRGSVPSMDPKRLQTQQPAVAKRDDHDEYGIIGEDEMGHTVAVVPGGFKPPHAGHYAVAKWFADNPDVDEVLVLISPKERAGHTADARIAITANMSLKLWKLYSKDEPKIKPEITATPSPVRAAYEVIDRLNPGDTIMLGLGQKDLEAGKNRFAAAQGYADKKGLDVKVEVVPIPPQAGGISGTQMRDLIAAGNGQAFKKFIPDHLAPRDKEIAWAIVSKAVDTTQNIAESIFGMIDDILNEREEYQDAVKAKHEPMKRRLIDTGPADAGVAFPNKPEYKRAKSSPPGFGGAREGKTNEVSAMAGGAVEGGSARKKPKGHLFNEDTDSISGGDASHRGDSSLTPIKSREEFMEELKLREMIRRAITIVKEDRHTHKLQEQRLRGVIRNLIAEVEVEDKAPHRSTGINVLEDLLKKVVPILEDDYKQLTTDEEQRTSFRAHIIKAVQNSLAPSRAREAAGASKEEAEKMIAINEIDGEIDITVGDGLDDVDDGEEVVDDTVETEEEKFIDVDDDGKITKDEEEAAAMDAFTIAGEDMTGRNMALQTFDKIESSILDSYGLLKNDDDKEVFYDYLLTNLKMYFDKFEDELKQTLEEPTTPEYEEASQAAEEETEEGEFADDMENLDDEEDLAI